MDLSTNYLGLSLRNPVIAGASPLTIDLAAVRELRHAGVGAIVMRSAFAESINDWSTTGTSNVPRNFISPEDYLRRIDLLKSVVDFPVIASLNGSRPGPWTRFARLAEKHGADAIELNLYHVSASPDVSGADVEATLLQTVADVRKATTLPLAVKLSPFFSSLPHFVRQLEARGVNGVVLFNRFFQHDIDVEAEGSTTRLSLTHMADPTELQLRLNFCSIIAREAKCSIALTGGVHTGRDVIKAVLAGADAVQVVSGLLRSGPSYVETILYGIEQWLKKVRHTDLRSLRGRAMGEAIDGLHRGRYMESLDSWPDYPPSRIENRTEPSSADVLLV